MSLLFLSILSIIPVLTLQMRAAPREDAAEPWVAEGDEGLLVRVTRQLSSMAQHLGSHDVQADRGEDHTVWHSYQFGYDSHSRDALRVHELRRLDDFPGARYNVTRWLTSHETRHVALGLAPSTLVICRFHDKNSTCFDSETTGSPTAATMFSTRNTSSQGLDVFVVCAVSDKAGTTLQWFIVRDDALAMISSPWPLLHAPSELQVFLTAGQHKLLALNTVQPPRTANTADVYDFQIESTGIDLWLSHKIQLNSATSVALSCVGDSVYLAVAQAQEEVLIFQLKDQKFDLINRIPSKGVQGICTFDISSSSFLAISGVAPRVLKMPPQAWDSTHVLHFTDDASVVRWLAVPAATYRDEVLLLAETEARRVELVTWTAPSTFAVDVKQTLNCEDNREPVCLRGLQGVSGLIMGASTALLVPRSSSEHRAVDSADAAEPRVVLAMTYLEHLACPAQLERQVVIEKRDAIQNLLRAHNAILEEAKRRLQNALQDNCVVVAPWAVEHVSANTVEVGQQFSAETLGFAGQDWSADDWDRLQPALDLAATAGVQQRRQQVDDLQANLSNAVFPDDDGNVEILGEQILQGNLEVQGNVYIKSAQLENLNDYSVADLLQNTARLNEKKIIRGHKVVSELHVKDLYVTNSLNGHVLHPFADNAKPIKLRGDVHFEKAVTINNTLAATETRETFRSADHDSEGTLQYAHLEAESVHVSGYINNQPVSHVQQQLASSHSTRQPLDTRGSLRVEGDVDATFINGLNVRDLVAQTVPLYTSQPFHIPGDTYIKSCHMRDVDVPRVNDMQFPTDFVLQGEAATVSGVKNFANLEVESLDIMDSVNSVPVADLVTLDTPQSVTGGWVLEDLTVLGDLQTSTVFEPDLPEILTSDTQTLEATGGVMFRRLNVAGNIVAAHSPWTKHLADVVYKDDPLPVITADKNFEGEVAMQMLHLHAPLNGINVSDYITLHTDQEIPGDKFLYGEVEFDSLEVSGRIFDVDFNSLISSVVRLSTNQTIRSEVVFTQRVQVNNSLRADALNNGLDGSDFVTLDSEQTIEGPLSFTRLLVDDMVVQGDVNTSSVFSGLDLTAVSNSRVSLTEDQVISGDWTMNHATIFQDLDIQRLNDIEVLNLPAQAIISELTNLEHVSLQELQVKGNIRTRTVNKSNMTLVVSDAVWLRNDNVVPSKLVVTGGVVCDNLTVNNDFVGVGALQDFVEDIVKTTDLECNFAGHKTFANGAHFRSVDVSFVNGKRMRDVLTVHGDQEVTGPVQFVNLVEITGHSDVARLNGLGAAEWCETYSFEEGCHILYGNVTFRDSFNATTIDVTQAVAGRDLEAYFSALVWVHDDVTINSNKTFANNVVIEKNLVVSKTINGLDLSEYMKEVVLIDRPNWVRTPITFLEDVFVDSTLVVDGDLDLQWLQGCSVKEWVTDAVYLDQQTPLIGAINFDSISCDGPINVQQLNKISMDRMVLLKEPQFITEVLTLSRVSTEGDVSVGGLVNGIRLDQAWEDTLLTESNQEVLGSKTFSAGVKVRRDLITYGTVNGHSVKDIVTLDTNQVINGPQVFTNVTVQGDMIVRGLVTGQDLSAWSQRVVLRDSPHGVITGRWQVEGNVTVLGSVLGSEATLLNKVHLPTLVADLQARADQASTMKADITRDRDILCQNVRQLLEIAGKQAYLFEYLEAKQYLSTSHPIASYIHFKLGADNMIALSLSESCEGSLLRWDAQQTQLSSVMKTSLGKITSWAVFPPLDNGDILLVTASGRTDCQHSGGNLWLVKNSQHLQLLHVKTMEVWNHVESSPEEPYVIHVIDADKKVSEWTYQQVDGLVKTKDLGLASGPKSDPRSSDADRVGADGLYLGPDFHFFSLGSTLKAGANYTDEVHPASLHSKTAPANFTVATVRHPARVQGNHDDIKIFEGSPQDNKLLHKVLATNPGPVQSVHFGPAREKFIVFLDDKTQLKLYKYQGIAGFTLDGSARFPGAQLLGVESLPTRNLLSPRAFILLATPKPNPGLFVLEMRMLGDPVVNLPLPDACRAE